MPHQVLIEPASPAAVEKAAVILARGGVVAFPTETVYGLGADAENPRALARLYSVKGRPEQHPVIVHIADAAQLNEWAVDIPQAARKLADAFWPGPLTLILPRSTRVPDAVTGGQETVGLRVPAHPIARELLRAFGGGLAAPSANRFGRVSPTQAAHVEADLGGDADMILDGGDCPVGVESTIVAFRDGQPQILRPGMITVSQIEAVLSTKALSATEGMPVRASGTLASHYAPKTPLMLVPAGKFSSEALAYTTQGITLGVLALREKPADLPDDAGMVWIQAALDASAYAHDLYAHLRQLDTMGLQLLLVEAVPAEDAWAAVTDRLQRASYRD